MDKISCPNCDWASWLKASITDHSSDLFISEDEQPILKNNGSFKRLTQRPISHECLTEMIDCFLPSDKRDQFFRDGEIDIGMDIEECGRFRVNVFKQHHGYSMAIRPLQDYVPTIDELKLPQVFHDFSQLHQGLVLITGPTGSGKSTTLAALVDAINKRDERHIITLEDPIEYVFDNKQRSIIHQREIGKHTSSFAQGLRSALRENPDVIVVGEMRDLESISLAIQAAETGHLVFATLHSGTASQAITRMLDVFDTDRQSQMRVQLSQSLQAVSAQRLFKRKDEEGMIVATEVMVATPALRTIIQENRIKEIRGFMEYGKAEKMHTLRQSAEELVRSGIVDQTALQQLEENMTSELNESDVLATV